jgi:hypothetical protein
MKRDQASRLARNKLIPLLILFLAHDLRKYFMFPIYVSARTKRERERGSKLSEAAMEHPLDPRAISEISTLYSVSRISGCLEDAPFARVHPRRGYFQGAASILKTSDERELRKEDRFVTRYIRVF